MTDTKLVDDIIELLNSYSIVIYAADRHSVLRVIEDTLDEYWSVVEKLQEISDMAIW